MKKDNLVWKIYILILLAAAVVTVSSAVHHHENGGFDRGKYSVIDSGLTFMTDDLERHDCTLPDYIRIAADSTYTVTYTLPEGIQDDDVLFLYTGDLDIRVYVNNVCIGNYQAAREYSFGKKIPAEWYMIKMYGSDSGEQLKICYDAAGRRAGGRLEKMYLGDKTAIIYHLLRANLYTVAASFIIVLMGVFILLYYMVAFIRKDVPQYACLGFFMMMAGMEMLADSPVRQVFMQNIGFAHYMSRLLSVYVAIPLLFYIIFMGKNMRNRFVVSGMFIFISCAVIDWILRAVFGIGELYLLYVSGIFAVCVLLFIQFFEEVAYLRNEDIVAYEMSEEKSRFLADMSHAIRTPVNTITGMDSLILRDSTDPSMLGHAADIKNAAASLVAIIDDILDLSSIETGKIQIESAEYDLSTLINDCYNMIIMRAQGKGLTLKVENNSDIPARLMGDEKRIRQIIINLLTNAVKYTRQGGVILGLDYEKVSDESILLRITVKDSGIGVKPENIDRLFTSYERVDEKKNRGIEGTGLGLSITKQLVALMNGEISVRSEYGSGSEFTVTIPQKIVSSEPVGSYDHRLSAGRNELPVRPVWFRAAGAHILVVDDVEMNLKVMGELLSASGMQVDLVSGGEECLRAAVQRRYDLIFMDHMMPAPDGIETFRRMKMLPGSLNEGTPVVMLTANAVAGAREQYLSEGFCGYLSKPVEETELMRICREQLDPELISENTAVNAVNGADEADMELLRALSGVLNVDEGLRYCMNKVGFYLNMLRDFADIERADHIRDYYDMKDTENYRINVHSLKSTARTVGADTISEEAQKLEEAARDGNAGYIVSCNETLISDYRKLAGRINEILEGKRNEKKQHIIIERDEMIQLLEKARDCAQIMDMDGTDEAVGRLAEVELDASLEEGLRKLRKAGNELEFEGIEAAAGEMLDILRNRKDRKEGSE